MEMRGMSGELLGTIGSSPGSGSSNPLHASRRIDETPQSSPAAEGPSTSVPVASTARPSRPLPPAFVSKKRGILAALRRHGGGDGGYVDKSPKGSVDVQVAELIGEINGCEGLVTTSSCAGRVSVFLEGERGRDRHEGGGGGGEKDVDESNEQEREGAVPGGKGLGGRWLFVSHEPLGLVADGGSGRWGEMFGLSESETGGSIQQDSIQLPRLVKFAFEPLILHVLCASLKHAQPLLTAAVNAGFRESGVQSLKILDEKQMGQEAEGAGTGAGVMVAIRTAGLGMESVVGVYVNDVNTNGEEGNGKGHARAIVSEDYLSLLVRVSEERFKANEGRRERLRREWKGQMERFALSETVNGGWEDKDARAKRKREEGLQRQRQLTIERSEGVR